MEVDLPSTRALLQLLLQMLRLSNVDECPSHLWACQDLLLSLRHLLKQESGKTVSQAVVHRPLQLMKMLSKMAMLRRTDLPRPHLQGGWVLAQGHFATWRLGLGLEMLMVEPPWIRPPARLWKGEVCLQIMPAQVRILEKYLIILQNAQAKALIGPSSSGPELRDHLPSQVHQLLPQEWARGIIRELLVPLPSIHLSKRCQKAPKFQTTSKKGYSKATSIWTRLYHSS